MLIMTAVLLVSDVAEFGASSTLFGADEIIVPSSASSDQPTEFGTAAANVVNQSGVSVITNVLKFN